MASKSQTGDDRCTECDQKILPWRRAHSDKCSECGPPLCRKCGQEVTNMEHTANGGLCKPCSRDIYGPGA